MFVVVVGGGKVGTNVTRTLHGLGHEVALVEQDRLRYEALEEELGERTVGYRIEDEDLEDLKTVRDAVDYVHDRTRA